MKRKYSLIVSRGIRAIHTARFREFVWQGYELFMRIIKRICHHRQVILNIVELVVTTKCTLKCKHCCNLMQYYSHPQSVDIEQICRDVDLLMQRVSYIGTVRLIGGEPFMVKGIPEMLAHIQKHKKKYCLIKVTTNGTIVPSEEVLKAMKEANVYVKISNYKEKSANLNALVDALKAHGILHEVLKVEWAYWRQLTDGNISGKEDVAEIYHKCNTECNNLLDGKLYHCPFLANGDKLGAFPHSASNYVDLTDTGVVGSDIKRYKSKDSVPPGCQYCSGNSPTAPSVPVAEQTREPLPFREYSRTN